MRYTYEWGNRKKEINRWVIIDILMRDGNKLLPIVPVVDHIIHSTSDRVDLCDLRQSPVRSSCQRRQRAGRRSAPTLIRAIQHARRGVKRQPAGHRAARLQRRCLGQRVLDGGRTIVAVLRARDGGESERVNIAIVMGDVEVGCRSKGGQEKDREKSAHFGGLSI